MATDQTPESSPRWLVTATVVVGAIALVACLPGLLIGIIFLTSAGPWFSSPAPTAKEQQAGGTPGKPTLYRPANEWLLGSWEATFATGGTGTFHFHADDTFSMTVFTPAERTIIKAGWKVVSQEGNRVKLKITGADRIDEVDVEYQDEDRARFSCRLASAVYQRKW